MESFHNLKFRVPNPFAAAASNLRYFKPLEMSRYRDVELEVVGVVKLQILESTNAKYEGGIQCSSN